MTKHAENALVSAPDVASVKARFQDAFRAFGFSYFDAGSLQASLLTTPARAENFFLCDYFTGDPWRLLPANWPAEDELTALLARSSAPIDYLSALADCSATPSILMQRGMLKMFRVKYAWLFPHNTLGHLRFVTVYMHGASAGEAQFRAARDPLFALSAVLIDRLEALHPQHKDPSLATRLIIEKIPVDLSKREAAYLGALAAGKANKTIAEELGVSENTVKYHLKRIFAKLGVSTRVEAVAIAFDQGLVER